MSGQARRVSALFYLAVLLITVVPGRAPAQSETATWTGTSGNWTTPSIWTTAPIAGLFPNNGQPAGTTYTVQVAGSGTITLNTTITVDQLGFNSGTITVPTAGLLNALVLNNNLTWGGGTFLGNAGGNSISVNANGGVTFPGGGLPILDAGALFIRGTTSTWSGGNITLQNGAILTNSFGSTLTASGNGTINLGGTSTLTSINNSGTFIKAGGTDMTAVMPPVTNNGVFAAATGLLTTNGIFTNNGTLLAAGGTIQINGPLNNLISGTLSGGTYQVQANSNLFLNGTVTTIGPNTTVELDGSNSIFVPINSVNSISGTFRLTGGRLFTTAGSLTLGNTGLPTAGTLDVQTGANLGVNGNLNINGPAQILNGAVTVSGTTAINSTFSVGAGASLEGNQLLSVGSPGILAVQGIVSQPVTVAGVLMGIGHVTGPTLIQQGGFLRPGSSPGTISLDGGLTLDGNYDWDLNGNDNTMAGGTFDNVKSGGVVTLAVTSQINIKIGGVVDFTNSFWSTQKTWPAITATVGFTDSTIPALTVNTNSYVAQYPSGAFSLAEQSNTLFVVWSPLPTTTWTGTNSGSWNDAGNWSPAVIPASSSDTQLAFGGTPNPGMTNDIPGTLTLNAMTFNSGAPAYTLSGNGLNFVSNSLGGIPQIVQNATNGVTMSVAMTLTNNLTVSGAGNLTLNGAIGGAGSLTYNGTATLTLGNAPNSYGGGTNVQSGTVQVADDGALGSGNVTVGGVGNLNYTGSTATTRTFTLNSGMVSVAAAQTLTLTGAQVMGGYLNGPGTFSTNAISGASFSGVVFRPSATINSNSSNDQFVNDTNGATFNVVPNLISPLSLVGMTNAGSGSITIGSKSLVNLTDFQSYGLVNVNNGASGVSTTVTNIGSTPLYFNTGSRTFIGTIGGNGLSDLELNGQNAIVAGGLFVNNGKVTDNSIAGISTIIADYGALVKGAGAYDNSPITRNGGRFQSGNSPGVATFGRFVFGPGGVSNYIFAIDNATGTAGPTPDANGHVSGWSLAKTGQWQRAGGATSGDFVWTADAAHPLTVALDTLVNPTTAGTDVPGLMADFDPSRSYSWPAVEWTGTYSGPSDVASLDAATNFDTSGFANPITGTFGWSLSVAQALSLSYTPSAVPEPGTLALVGLAAVSLAWRRKTGPVTKSTM